jgi:5'-3' exonuclease
LKEETYLPEAHDTYDLERVIDDFVLLCVLVGNDFLPHSPTLDIGEGAMDVIFERYRNTLVRHGLYLTQGERISHVQLELLVSALAETELDTLIQRAQVRHMHVRLSCSRGESGCL